MSGVAGGSTIWESLPAVAWTLIGKRPAAKSPAPPDAAATRMKFRREQIGLVAPLALSAESRFINRLRATCCSFRRRLRTAPSCFCASYASQVAVHRGLKAINRISLILVSSEAGTLLCPNENQRCRRLHISPWRRLSRAPECRQTHGVI